MSFLMGKGGLIYLYVPEAWVHSWPTAVNVCGVGQWMEGEMDAAADGWIDGGTFTQDHTSTLNEQRL